MFSCCEWDIGYSCNRRKNCIYKCLIFFVSIMYILLNTSFYVASIQSETQPTVFNMKGCMEKMPVVSEF